MLRTGSVIRSSPFSFLLAEKSKKNASDQEGGEIRGELAIGAFIEHQLCQVQRFNSKITIY
jgi:hypothetical protein